MRPISNTLMLLSSSSAFLIKINLAFPSQYLGHEIVLSCRVLKIHTNPAEGNDHLPDLLNIAAHKNEGHFTQLGLFMLSKLQTISLGLDTVEGRDTVRIQRPLSESSVFPIQGR